MLPARVQGEDTQMALAFPLESRALSEGTSEAGDPRKPQGHSAGQRPRRLPRRTLFVVPPLFSYISVAYWGWPLDIANTNITRLEKQGSPWDFPGSPVGKIPHSQHRAPGFDPWLGN